MLKHEGSAGKHMRVLGFAAAHLLQPLRVVMAEARQDLRCRQGSSGAGARGVAGG